MDGTQNDGYESEYKNNDRDIVGRQHRKNTLWNSGLPRALVMKLQADGFEWWVVVGWT
jgi:hypothetical protein